MRRHIASELLAFTVTKPMFERLCRLDERSFFGKRFLRQLEKARAGEMS